MATVLNFSLLTDFDVSLFVTGKHFRIYEKLGSHLLTVDGVSGTYFAVWAPTAQGVCVMGSFNNWHRSSHALSPRWDSSGIWEGFVPGVGHGSVYKYSITTAKGLVVDRSDLYARRCETPPLTASVVWEGGNYAWRDDAWLATRLERSSKPQPFNVYEVHLGSWRRHSDDSKRSYSYRELADTLVPYVRDLGFTHVELMPMMEHPYEPSWGYQLTGFYAPTSRFGTPEDFKFLVDAFHEAGIGVILDWVPSHFPTDAHGLGEYDGSRLYEHEDPRQGYHPDWKSLIFNYGRPEVRSFLISNAMFWADHFHADGLRVDAVASMLYLDYSRKEGEWLPNMYGGKENLEAISLLREFNTALHASFPDVVTIAEESTAWFGVSKPVHEGGLGFDQKWMMGWMHDTLRYFARESLYRQYHQDEVSFSIIYAFSERFMLPFSHDEVVHGKGSLLGKMPGDEWQRFANLRLMLGYMFTHPGTRLLFMGCEFGQYREWAFEGSLDWNLLDFPLHLGVQSLVRDLNDLTKKYPALYHHAFSHEGFEWIALDDRKNAVITYLRKGGANDAPLIVVCNMTPAIHEGYRVGVPVHGVWRELLNTDDAKYGGSNVRNVGDLKSDSKIEKHDREQSLEITLAPLATTVFVLEKAIAVKKKKKVG